MHDVEGNMDTRNSKTSGNTLVIIPKTSSAKPTGADAVVMPEVAVALPAMF